MDIVIFGAGKFYDNRKWAFQNFRIVAFLDNNSELHNKTKDGIKIISPEEIRNLSYDGVVIMSTYIEEMKQQLLENNVPCEKIYRFNELNFLNDIEEITISYNNRNFENSREKKILLLTHELSLSGGPLVVFQFAKLLKQKGYNPIIASLEDGKLKDEILAEDISVIVCNNISKHNFYMWEWLKTFELIIANTIAFYYLINQAYNTDMKIIWWLHDIFDKEAAKNLFPIDGISKNVSIYTGGRFVKNSFIQNYNFENLEIFLYGIPDKKNGKFLQNKDNKEKLVFAVIASVEPRKGQDVLAQALEYISEDVINNAEFWIIGKARNEYLQKFYDDVKVIFDKIPQVKMFGEVNSDELWKLYEKIDVVVCPSRNDPMPVVVTNGMMLNKTCIVSDMTGQADFIKDSKNGFVCKTENIKELVEKITWVINNRDKLYDIGNKSRLIYEQNLSMDVFETNALNIIENKIKE